ATLAALVEVSLGAAIVGEKNNDLRSQGETEVDRTPALVLQRFGKRGEEVVRGLTQLARKGTVLNGTGGKQGVQLLGELLEALLEGSQIGGSGQTGAGLAKIVQLGANELKLTVQEDTMPQEVRTRRKHGWFPRGVLCVFHPACLRLFGLLVFFHT